MLPGFLLEFEAIAAKTQGGITSLSVELDEKQLLSGWRTYSRESEFGFYFNMRAFRLISTGRSVYFKGLLLILLKLVLFALRNSVACTE